MKKKALITGITGQDGSYLAEFLLEKGYEVHGIKRRASSLNTQRIDHIYEDPHTDNQNFILHYGDLTDSSNLTRILSEVQPDEVYNLGAQSHVAVSFEAPEYTADVDAMGTLRLLEAIRFLGIAYRRGHFGLVKSDKKAAKIYRRAVELGDVDAMVCLGAMYSTGLGVKLDKKKAERLYRMAADRGDPVAQNNLGTVLHSEERFEEAFRYYALAADQGYTDAELNLGCCYRDGEGTEVDLGKARYWFERAAAKGDEIATRNLAHLDARV